MVLEHSGGPVYLDDLVRVLLSLLQLREQPIASLDDTDAGWAEHLEDTSQLIDSHREEAEILRRLWDEVRQLPPKQRETFCLSFADRNGEDLFTLLLYNGDVTLAEIARGLERSSEDLQKLWARMPFDAIELAELLGATRANVNKWRFRAVEKLSRVFSIESPAK